MADGDSKAQIEIVTLGVGGNELPARSNGKATKESRGAGAGGLTRFRGNPLLPFDPLPRGKSDRSPTMPPECNEDGDGDGDGTGVGHEAAAEKQLTLFAMRLAILEKSATSLGTIAFIWATVVLLGGFASALAPIDFWSVTAILLVESTRIFSRSHELEWQHQASLENFYVRAELSRLTNSIVRAIFHHSSRRNSSPRAIPDCNISTTILPSKKKSSLRGKRTWSRSAVRLIPYTGMVFVSANASVLLFWVQIVLGFTCVGLSLFRLSKRDFGSPGDQNQVSALTVFYAMSLAEAILFLMEKGFWYWKIFNQKMLHRASDLVGFETESWGADAVHRFFYDAYGLSVSGSIFDGLKMDFLTFGVDLLLDPSDDFHAHLTGARILRSLALNPEFAEDTLRSIGTMRDVVNRLVEILSWKNDDEHSIRLAAADTVLQLVYSDRNCVRVAAIEGSLQSISSLLYSHRKSQDAYQQYQQRQSGQPYDYHGFTVLGLKILNNLARYYENCCRIGATRGLLPKIVDGLSGDDVCEGKAMEIAQLSLRLLTRLASCTGSTGKDLRKNILENVDTVSNIRHVLQDCSHTTHGQLQILSLEALTSLALDPEGRGIIGDTGGILSTLLTLFFSHDHGEDGDRLVASAGEALALLALDTPHNCTVIAELRNGAFVHQLVNSLRDRRRGVACARILRSILRFADADGALLWIDVVKNAAVDIMSVAREATATAAKSAVEAEAALGLAAQLLRLPVMDEKAVQIALSGSGTSKDEFLRMMQASLQVHRRPSKVVPDMRRYCVEVIRGFVACDVQWVERWDVRSALRRDLEELLDSTCEMENYNTISGSVGLNRHAEPLRDLVSSTLCYFGSI